MAYWFYLATPFLAWLCAGCLKFIVNSVRFKRLAFDKIGYGGFPSNHSAIVSSMVAMIGLQDGIDHPAFGVAITVAFVVTMDANSLRRQVGFHARCLNGLSHGAAPILRERIGHTKIEILAGIVTGGLVAFLFHWLGSSAP